MRLGLAVALLVAGCVHPVMLKKYSATSPARAGITGRTVYVAPFVDRREVEWDEKKSVPLVDPKGFEAKDLTSEQLDAWTRERDRLEASLPEPKWTKVGHKRNAFGMPIQDVLSVNGPAEWLTEAAGIELDAQGAKRVGSPGEADLVVEGVLRHAWLDLVVPVTWVHLVLDVTTTLRGQQPKTVRIHASEGRAAWSGNEVESFELYTATEQKLSRFFIDHVAAQLNTGGALGAPPPPP